MKRIYLILLILFFSSEITFSQGELQDGRMYNRDERTFAIQTSSIGSGINFQVGKRIDGFNKRLFFTEFSTIKHSKEIKTQNPYLVDGNKRFVFGKINSVFDFRFGYGKQKEAFGKHDKGGISIRYFYSGGVSVALSKPVYYNVIDSIYYDLNYDKIYIATSKHKFSTTVHQVSDIESRAPFFDGFNETKLTPGLFAKFGLSIEYSNTDEIINAIEAGVIVEAFPKKLEIMASDVNDQFFVSLFLAYRFGKVTSNRIN